MTTWRGIKAAWDWNKNNNENHVFSLVLIACLLIVALSGNIAGLGCWGVYLCVELFTRNARTLPRAIEEKRLHDKIEKYKTNPNIGMIGELDMVASPLDQQQVVLTFEKAESREVVHV